MLVPLIIDFTDPHREFNLLFLYDKGYISVKSGWKQKTNGEQNDTQDAPTREISGATRILGATWLCAQIILPKFPLHECREFTILQNGQGHGDGCQFNWLYEDAVGFGRALCYRLFRWRSFIFYHSTVA